jgi:hypothetical protein
MPSSGACWDELAPAELRHIEPGLAEESDHMGPKVLGSVLSRRCEEQAVDQRANEHVGQRFDVGILGSMPAVPARSNAWTNACRRGK